MIRALQTYFTSAISPYGKEVDRRAATTYLRQSNHAPLVNNKSATTLLRAAGPTAAAIALRFSYIFRLVSPPERRLTNTLIAANVLAHIAQHTSGGKLLYWGAKTNDLVSKRQWWRLVTSSFLHSNVGHLMASCYSLNQIGPAVEVMCGPRRYLTVYIASAIAGSGTSYALSRAATVGGASGAIFGLMGSCVTFLLTHPDVIEDDDSEYFLTVYCRKIVIDLAAGMLCNGTDKWGHVVGLIGGVAASWLVGTDLKFEYESDETTVEILNDYVGVPNHFSRVRRYQILSKELEKLKHMNK